MNDLLLGLCIGLALVSLTAALVDLGGRWYRVRQARKRTTPRVIKYVGALPYRLLHR